MKRVFLMATFLSLLFLAVWDLDAKRPTFKNTKWVCEDEMFVADVGTMTETYTLEFGPGNEIVIRDEWFMPAHPATYVNADGSVDVLPARHGEQTSKGTWKYRRGKLTVTLEDGTEEVYRYKDDTLVQTDPTGSVRVFHR